MADNSILTRLDGLKLKYEEIGQKLTDPEVIADVKQFIQFNKEYRELEPIIEASERYRTAIANLAEAKDIQLGELEWKSTTIRRKRGRICAAWCCTCCWASCSSPSWAASS